MNSLAVIAWLAAESPASVAHPGYIVGGQPRSQQPEHVLVLLFLRGSAVRLALAAAKALPLASNGSVETLIIERTVNVLDLVRTFKASGMFIPHDREGHRVLVHMFLSALSLRRLPIVLVRLAAVFLADCFLLVDR